MLWTYRLSSDYIRLRCGHTDFRRITYGYAVDIPTFVGLYTATLWTYRLSSDYIQLRCGHTDFRRIIYKRLLA